MAAYESRLGPAETEQAIEEFLKRFDPDAFTREEETRGFNFLFTSDFFSAFDYSIFGTAISSRISTTVIRIEGNTGDVHTLTRVLELENILAPDSIDARPGAAVSLDPKSHLIAQSLNLAAPWIGVWYNSYHSPRLSLGQTWFRSIAYLLADGLLLWMSGTKFWAGPFDASANSGLIGGALLIPRIIGAVQSYNFTSGHNRLIEMKYTFHLD